MLRIDIAVAIPHLLAFLLWCRGLWRQNKGDVILSACIFIVALVMYAVFYAITKLTNLPWLVLIAYAVAAALIPVLKRDLAYHRGLVMAIALPACLSAVLYGAEQAWSAPANSLMVIVPYKRAGIWMFDDPGAGLRAEPFVSGIPELIDKLLLDAQITSADDGFRLLFSMRPFPGHQEGLAWRRQQDGGNWYYSEKYDLEGWLCPALFKYFKRPPKRIYVRAEPIGTKPTGANANKARIPVSTSQSH